MGDRDDEMLALYLSESEQNLQMLDGLLLDAQRVSSLSPQAVAEAFRLVHTLKGASAMMRYHSLERSSHLLEDILSALRGGGPVALGDGEPDILGVCFQYADCFTQQLERIRDGEELLPSEGLDGALQRAADAMHLHTSAGVETPCAPPVPTPQGPPGSAPLLLRLRKCSMPHIRCSVVIRAVQGLCESILTVPRDIELHPELGEHILENGLELFVTPKGGTELAQICEKLTKQPFVASVSRPEPGDAPQGLRPRESTLHIPQARLNELLAVLDELVTTQAMLAGVLEDIGVTDSRAGYLMDRLRHDAAQAKDLSMEMGMVEIGTVFQQMRRLVRMMAQEYGKSIGFSSRGDAVPVDGSMLETVSDALLHLVRNAVDHGIEPPDSRLRAGKSAEGSIALSARKENGALILTVEDDGRGVDRKAVLEKAAAKGLLPPDRESLSDGELLDILASPGFSTMSDVSRYSGRGVGLDTAVRRVGELRGSIALESAQGRGTRFTLRIPASISLLNVLTLRIGGDRVLLPASAVAAVCFAGRVEEREDRALFREAEYARLRMPGDAGDSEDGEEDVLVFLAPEYGRYYLRTAPTDMAGEMLLLPLPPCVADTLGRDCVFGGCCIHKDGAILCVLDIYKLIAVNDTGLKGGDRDEDL